MKKIKNGEILHLGSEDGVSRRTVLRTLSVAGIGTLGLSKTIQRVYGSKPEGVPIVHTDDVYGNPDKVRIIPKERYRRIQTYTELPISKLIDKHPHLNSVGLVQQSNDERDLALKFFVDKNTRAVRQNIPNRINKIPVITEEQPVEYTPESLEGGSAINDDSSGYNGTLTVVGYDKSTDDETAVTADHVMDGASTMYSNGSAVADYDNRDSGTDTTAYTVRSGTSVDVGGTVSIPDVTGAWQFSGLADAVGNTDDGDSVSDGGTVDVQLYGATSGEVNDYCNNVKRSGKVEYQADMAHHRTDGGDSGGPWVDDNGKLLACHYGYSTYLLNEWSVGSVGRESLDAVNVKLSQ